MSPNPKWEKVKEQLKQNQRSMGRLFLSEDGKKLLEVLRATWYDGDLFGSTPESTAFNLGAREVIKYLLFLRDSAKPESE